jgi:hypothetical protein
MDNPAPVISGYSRLWSFISPQPLSYASFYNFELASELGIVCPGLFEGCRYRNHRLSEQQGRNSETVGSQDALMVMRSEDEPR